MNKFDILHKVVKRATLLGLTTEIDTDKGELCFIEIYGKNRYFGYYLEGDTVQFFVHESKDSDDRLVYFCKESDILSYLSEFYNNPTVFIKNHSFDLNFVM